MVNKIVMLLGIFCLLSGTVSAQNLNSTNGGYAKTRKIGGKKFRVMYYEYEVNRSVEDVWAEVSGNFIHVSQIVKSIEKSHCESGDVKEGLGAARFCRIDFAGKKVEIKERITDVKEAANRKEFTYDVYESKGFPAKVYNTWVVRKGADGKTYLGNTFVFRAKPAMMTGMMGKKIKKMKAVRNTVLTFKHFLETGEKKPDPAKFTALYPEV